LTTSYSYDEAGRLIAETDPLGRTTSYVYDEAGRMIGMELPNGGVWTDDYDAVGIRTAVTDPLDQTTTYDYDNANRLVAVTGPLGTVTSYGYDAASRQTSVTIDPGASPHLNLTTTYEYDTAGRVIREIDPLGHATAYSYDGNGNLISVTNAENETTLYEYDEADRLIEITDPLSRVTTYTYDAAGQRIAETRPDGTVIAASYDLRGLLTSQTIDPNPPGQGGHLALTTSYVYDDAGRRIAMTNPRGKTTSYAYDAANRLTTITDALNHTVTFEYDAAGQATEITNPRGKTSSYTFDGLGNVLTATAPLDRTDTFTYNLLGQETQHTDPHGVVIKSVYDAAGRVTQVTAPQGTIAYTYDDADRRATMTLPGNRTVAYAYDAAGQLVEVTDWASRTTTFGYDGAGRLDAVTRPNEVVSAYDYDAAGRLTAVEHADGATLLSRYAYGLDANGNRTAVLITGTAVTNGTESYAFDDLDRLTGVTYPDASTVEYVYDANGNRTSAAPSGQTATSYSYDDADQLTSTSGGFVSSYSYDDAGNRAAAGNDTFAYDWRDRLTAATVGSTTVEYEYAGDDLRVSRTEDAVTTPFLWDREAGLPEVVDDGTRVYLQVGGGELAAIDSGTSDATYPLPDALGSARASTDGSGSVIATADWDIWGNLRASSGAGEVFGWTGELRDPATNLVYLRARDYSPGTGRFASRDTASPNGPGRQGYNPYAWPQINPATFTDPTGHGLDFGSGIAGVTEVIRLTHELVVGFNGLPSYLRPFMLALIGFIVGLVRTVIVLFVVALFMQFLAGLFPGLVGAAVVLLGLANMVNALEARRQSSPAGKTRSGVGLYHQCAPPRRARHATCGTRIDAPAPTRHPAAVAHRRIGWPTHGMEDADASPAREPAPVDRVVSLRHRHLAAPRLRRTQRGTGAGRPAPDRRRRADRQPRPPRRRPHRPGRIRSARVPADAPQGFRRRGPRLRSGRSPLHGVRRRRQSPRCRSGSRRRLSLSRQRRWRDRSRRLPVRSPRLRSRRPLQRRPLPGRRHALPLRR
jgi:RHS repeat-associated protein